MADTGTASSNEVSEKLNVIIALLLHFASKDERFNDGRHKIGDLAVFLKNHGLNYNDIAAIIGSPVESIRVLVHLKKRTGKKKKNKGK